MIKPPFTIRSVARMIYVGGGKMAQFRRWYVYFRPSTTHATQFVGGYNTFAEAVHHVDTAVARYQMRSQPK
jgi:hypothetical protein